MFEPTHQSFQICLGLYFKYSPYNKSNSFRSCDFGFSMSPSSGSTDLIRPVALAVPSGMGFGLLWYPGPPICLPGGSRAAAISLTHWQFRSGYKESHLGLLFDFRDACVSRPCSSMTVHFFFEPLIGAGKHCASASRSIHCQHCQYHDSMSEH